MFEVLLSFLIVAVVATVVITICTWPMARYIVKGRGATRQFRLGKIRDTKSLTPLQIIGERTYYVDLLTGTAFENTIDMWGSLFEAHAEEAGLEGVSVYAYYRALGIRKITIEELPEKAKLIRRVIEQTNKSYFDDMEVIREEAKRMEL